MAKAKKLRRARKKSQPVRLSPAQLVRPVEEAAAAPLAAAGEAASASGLNEELGYAAADLRRVGLIAAGLLVVLIVLAVVLV